MTLDYEKFKGYIYNCFKDSNKKVDVKPAVDAKLVTKQSLNIVAVCLHLGCFFVISGNLSIGV